MAIFVFISAGAIIGWLASILAREEAPVEIRKEMLIGAIAALFGAAIIGGTNSIFSAVELVGFAAATGSAAIVLLSYWFVFVRRT